MVPRSPFVEPTFLPSCWQLVGGTCLMPACLWESSSPHIPTLPPPLLLPTALSHLSLFFLQHASLWWRSWSPDLRSGTWAFPLGNRWAGMPWRGRQLLSLSLSLIIILVIFSCHLSFLLHSLFSSLSLYSRHWGRGQWTGSGSCPLPTTWWQSLLPHTSCLPSPSLPLLSHLHTPASCPGGRTGTLFPACLPCLWDRTEQHGMAWKWREATGVAIMWRDNVAWKTVPMASHDPRQNRQNHAVSPPFWDVWILQALFHAGRHGVDGHWDTLAWRRGVRPHSRSSCEHSLSLISLSLSLCALVVTRQAGIALYIFSSSVSHKLSRGLCIPLSPAAAHCHPKRLLSLPPLFLSSTCPHGGGSI